MTLGVFFLIEAFERDADHARSRTPGCACRRTGLGRTMDPRVPLRDPSFGDIGQVYDPWVWLGWIAAHTV
jgi:hypothetical protein